MDRKVWGFLRRGHLPFSMLLLAVALRSVAGASLDSAREETDWVYVFGARPRDGVIQLLLELQVTARKKILVAGANVTYKFWEDKIEGNVDATLTVPEDGSMLSLDGKAAYTISADSWSVTKPEKQKHAMTGSLLNGIATLTGDIDMQGSNRRPTLFPRGYLSGNVAMDRQVLIDHPDGFSPFVVRGERCEQSDRTCSQDKGQSNCYECAVETMGDASFAYLVRGKLKFNTASKIYFSSNGVTGRFLLSASFEPLVTYLEYGDDLKAATGRLSFEKAQVDVDSHGITIRGKATFAVTGAFIKIVTVNLRIPRESK